MGTVSLGAVQLAVADLDRAREFYQRTIGLRALDAPGDAVALGVGDAPLVELIGEPAAPPRPPGTTGLFHLAILVPDRAELARALRRVADAGWRLSGASDHLVSEAIYLSDPEGNGIEIYRDRPREDWRYEDGQLRMATLPLDPEPLLSEPPGTGGDVAELAAETRIGHVHLNVSDLAASEDFYGRLLGFDVTVRDYPGALFLSAGGYHHHIGLNTWAGEGAPPPPPGARGLRRYEVAFPSGELDAIAARLGDAGVDHRRADGSVRVDDPSGNGVLLTPGPPNA